MKMRLLGALLGTLLPLLASAQSVPNGTIAQGQVWSASQWNSAWGAKVDVTGGVLYNPAINSPTLNITGLIQCLHVSATGVVSGTGADCGAGGGGSSAFGSITSGTNNAANMAVGSGASLTPSGSGIVEANQVISGISLGTPTSIVLTYGTQLPLTSGVVGILPTANGGIGASSLAGASIVTVSGSITSGHCAQWQSSFVVTDSGATCGSGGSNAFSSLTSSINVTASMGVGSGASLTPSGSGIIEATTLASLTGLPSIATQTLLGNGSGSAASAIALAIGGNLVATASGITTSQPINPQAGTTYTIQSTDAGKLLTLSNSSTVAVTLPQAGTTGFGTGFSLDVENLGSGTAIITPATSTINGASSLTVAHNNGCTITSDGTNYQVSACTAISSGGGGGSGTVNSATTNEVAYYASSGNAVSGAPLGGSLAFSSGGSLITSQAVNAQTGTSYAMLSTDAGKLVTFNNASAVAVSLSQATTTGFTAGYSFDVHNIGAGTVTITPATSTIDGASTLTIAQDRDCTVTSDGTNYQISACTAKVSGTSTTFQANGTNLISSSTVNFENGTGIAITNPSAGNVQVSTTYGIDAQTGTSYTIASTDAGKLVTHSNASSIAVTVPQATSTFGAGFGFDQVNLGAGVATDTPTTSTVNGQTTLPLMQGEGASWTSDGTNWRLSATNAAYAFGASTVAGTGCTPSASQLTSGSNGTIAGTITLAATCTAVTITAKAAAKTGWTCDVGDRTTQAAGTYIPHWGETATTAATISIPIPAAAGTTDVITVLCARN